MCGIAGVYLRSTDSIIHRKLGMIADELLGGIMPRGVDATGLLAMGPHSLHLEKEPLSARIFAAGRKRFPSSTRALLLHTRAVTQGTAKVNANNHPVQYGSTFVVHNGWIYNDAETFAELQAARMAEVDTEAIAAAINLKGWEAACSGEAFEGLQGAFAVAAVDPVQAPGELLLVRGNYSPLCVLSTADAIMFASTWDAIAGAWSRCIGTPPRESRAEYVKEGTVIRLQESGESTVKTFTPASEWGTQTRSFKWPAESKSKKKCCVCNTYSTPTRSISGWKVCKWCEKEIEAGRTSRIDSAPLVVLRELLPRDGENEDDYESNSDVFRRELAGRIAEYTGYDEREVRDILEVAEELEDEVRDDLLVGL